MRQFDRIAEYLVVSLLILSGLAGVVIGFADFIGWNIQALTSKSPLDLILVTVGVLATAIGLERIGRFRRYDQYFEKFELLLTNTKSGQHLVGHDETYQQVNRLCGKAKTRVRALLHQTTPQFSAPPAWPMTVAQRLKTAQSEGRPARLDAVIACNFQNLPRDFEETIEKRRDIYRKYKVESLASPYLLNVTHVLGFDIFIIDNDHAIIAFRSAAGMQMVDTALLFENQPDIVSDLVEWFDHFIREPAIAYEKWLAERPKPT